MERIKCTLSYDGTHFSGYQIQPENRTVQGELEKVLMTIHKNQHIRVQGSGRTDAGVHAKGQTFHFDSFHTLPERNWRRALNALLPADIYITEVHKVSKSFHARFDALEKEYRYYVWNGREPDIFCRNYIYHFKHPLNNDAIKRACDYLEGTHDFTSFTSAKATVRGSKVRTLYEVACKQNGNEIEFTFRGPGFLYNMARILVGTLLEIGQGKRNPSDIPDIFAKRDRRFAGETAPPQGLYLWHVKYE